MIDVKKFVVAFLILAALTSSSALVLSGFGSASSRQPPVAQTSNPIPFSSANAFAPTPSPTTDTGSPAGATAASSSDSQNLTARLADSLLNNIIAANPDGPRDDGSGNQLITAPSAVDVLSDISTSSALENLKIPDWDFDAAMQTVRISTSSSDTDITRYGDALNSIVNNYFIKSGLQNIVTSKSTGPDTVSFISSQIKGALGDIGGLTAPKDLADFHKDFLKLLTYEKNALDLAQNASDDPMRAALIFQAEDGKYNAALQEFQNTWQKAIQNKAFSFALPQPPARRGGAAAFLENIFGMPTAHAQWITFDPTTFAQMVWEFVQSMVLQMLKNLLVTQIQNKVLKLIQNKGNPKFIQSWSGLLSSAFNVAAGSALGQIEPGLCGHFSTDVSGWLQNVYSSAKVTQGGFSLNGSPGTTCTLNNVVSNINGFNNDFNVGGWNGYGALLSPNNNPYGAFAEAYDLADLSANSAKTASQNKGIASQGYKGQEFCDDGSNPDGGYYCVNVNDSSDYYTVIDAVSACDPGYSNQFINNGGFCLDGWEPFVSTPGKNFGDTMSKNMNASIDLIVNANDITGLLATIVGALLQQVITSGMNGLLGAKPAGTGSPATSAPPTVPVACNTPLTNAAVSSPLYFSATGGTTNNYTWSAPGGTPATGIGSLFTASFAYPGTYTVVLTNVGTSTNTVVNCSAVTITQ